MRSANGWQYAQQAGQCNFPYSFYCFGTDLNWPVLAPATSGRRVFVSSKAITLTSIASADAECQTEKSGCGPPEREPLPGAPEHDDRAVAST